MLFYYLVFLLIGIIFGTLTGLTPGIHINLISTILISISIPLYSKIPTIYLIIFITSMSITHTFLDFIPSIFLGCPEEDTALSVLPGHKFLKKGLAYPAIMLTNYGSLFGAIYFLLFFYPIIFIMKLLYNPIQKNIGIIILLLTIYLILKQKNKINALLIFFLSGILGLLTLNLNNQTNPLLPLLCGLFGAPSIIYSIKNKTKIPEQKIFNPRIKKLKILILSFLITPIITFLPSLGTGQSVILTKSFLKNTTQKEYLFLQGIINTLVMCFSIITLYQFNITRTGSAIAIKTLLQEFTLKHLFLILLTISLTAIISFYLTKNLSKIFAQKINKINYTKISISTLILLLITIILFSKIQGIFIFLFSTSIGLLTIKLKTNKTNMMACLMVPTIIFYL
jgi:putative membrane protein